MDRRRYENSVIEAVSETGSTTSGVVQFGALVSQGALVYNSPSRSKNNYSSVTTSTMMSSTPAKSNETAGQTSPRYIGGGGFVRDWDFCSDTPFLRSETVGQIITYDDLQSFEMKGIFAAKVGLKGVNMFHVGGDSLSWDLTTAITRGLQSK